MKPDRMDCSLSTAAVGTGSSRAASDVISKSFCSDGQIISCVAKVEAGLTMVSSE